MTATAALLVKGIVKSLLVTTAYMPAYLQRPAPHSVTLSLRGSRSVVLVADAAQGPLEDASLEELAAVKAIAKHYAAFLKGGALPSAPEGITTTHHVETEHEGGGLEVFELTETKETKRVNALRNILKEGQCKVVEGKMVDTFSASAFIQVYDAVNEANKAKLLSFSLPGAIGACFKLINNQRNK